MQTQVKVNMTFASSSPSNTHKAAARNAGQQMNYHSTDSLALSILVEEIAQKSLAKYFHSEIYSQFGKSGFMQWTSDKSGTTVSFSDLVMTAQDWANFGQYLMRQKQSNSCLGRYFNEGVKKAVATGKKNRSKYGYQSWVFPVNGEAAMVLQGHSGQFIVLSSDLLSTSTIPTLYLKLCLESHL